MPSNLLKIHTLVYRFLEYLEIEKNVSKLTLRNYTFYLDRFIKWLDERNVDTIDKMNQSVMREYRIWLNRYKTKHDQVLRKNTQNYHLIAIRNFLKYLAKVDVSCLDHSKIELARVAERQVQFLDHDDLNRLLEAPLMVNKSKVVDSNIIMARDKAILELLFSTGLRVSELTGLYIDNINLKKDSFTIRGKGDKLRLVFLSKIARLWIAKYLDLRKDLNPYLFISHNINNQTIITQREGLTNRSIQRLIIKYAKVAGITKKVTPHTLRHSFATDLLMNGANLRSVQELLGHTSISTTQIYTHLTDQHLNQVYQTFHDTKRK